MKQPTRYTTQTGKIRVIKWQARLKEEGVEVSGTNTDGVIQVNTSRSPMHQATTLLHELIHEARKAPIHVRGDEIELDEVCTLTVEMNLATMWRANRSVFAWIHANIGELK